MTLMRAVSFIACQDTHIDYFKLNTQVKIVTFVFLNIKNKI